MMGAWILWRRSQAAAFLLEINGSPDSPNIPTELLFQVPNIGRLTVALIYCHTLTSGGGSTKLHLVKLEWASIFEIFVHRLAPLNDIPIRQ